MRSGAQPALVGAAAGVCLAVLGCTSVSIVQLPQPAPGARRILVTTGGVSQPYQSLGLVQIYRSGAYLVGWIPVPNMDLQTTFEEYLLPEAERRGADAVINVRFHEDQYSPAFRVIMMIPPFIILPLPASTTVTGELVKFLPPTPG